MSERVVHCEALYNRTTALVSSLYALNVAPEIGALHVTIPVIRSDQGIRATMMAPYLPSYTQ